MTQICTNEKAKNVTRTILNFCAEYWHWSNWKYMVEQEFEARLRDERTKAIIRIIQIDIWTDLKRYKEHFCFSG